MRYRILLAFAFLAAVVSPVLADVRVMQADALKFVTSRPQPEYSAVAKQMKIAGRVEIEVVIATDGGIESVKALSGNPLLTGPTVTALKKWKFNPIVLDGAAVKAVTTFSFDFK